MEREGEEKERQLARVAEATRAMKLTGRGGGLAWKSEADAVSQLGRERRAINEAIFLPIIQQIEDV